MDHIVAGRDGFRHVPIEYDKYQCARAVDADMCWVDDGDDVRNIQVSLGHR